MAFHNLEGFERSISTLYKENRNLSEKYAPLKERVKFFSYLRNKFIGHVATELVEKALEWKPEIRISLHEEYDPKLILLYNWALLETAINSYVDQSGNHKIFASETDLNYPRDNKRFRDILIATIDEAADFMADADTILRAEIPEVEGFWHAIRLYLKAGRTKFEFIGGKGR